MANLSKNKLLSEKIAAILQKEKMLDDRSLRFINTTFSSPPIEAITRILSDPKSSDAWTIYELSLFPGEQIHMELEPELALNEYAPSDMDEICRILAQTQINTVLYFPEDRVKINMPVPQSAVATFIQRLNIINSMHPALVQTLARCIHDPDDYLKARVWLRNRRFELSESILYFLMELIEKTYPGQNLFWKALDYMMEFFNTFPSIQDIESALVEKKRDCVELKESAERNHQALKENAVETLLMKGTRIASVCVEEIEKEIRLIDDILSMLCGNNA